MEILHRHGIGYCAKCPTRDHCVVLCSRAEAYVGQDYAAQIEITIGLPMIETKEEMVSDKETPHYTPIQKGIVRLLARGYNKNKICEVLEITTNSYFKNTSIIRKKIRES